MLKLMYYLLTIHNLYIYFMFNVNLSIVEVENGVLGLERDIYLSIVKFLDLSILRKV
jgi:hypothetical protein